MIVRVKYFGFFPLGSDVELDEVRIMQSEWNEYTKPIWVFGKKHVINPFFCNVFYIKQDKKTVFFAAYECGIGKYHIFTINEKDVEKLKGKVIV